VEKLLATASAGPEISQIAIYLTKPKTNLEDAIEWPTIVRKPSYTRRSFAVGERSCEFIYFITQAVRDNPPWLDFVNAQLSSDQLAFRDQSKSPNGILAITIRDRLFIATFGRAASGALKRDQLEPDFGIKAAMNLCGNEEIRQTRTQSHSVTPTHIDRQTSRPSEAFVFGLSDAEDLKFISAHMKADSSVTLQGRDHLTLKVIGTEKLSWEKLIDYCEIFATAYNDDSYVKLFPNYRNFKPASSNEIKTLDAALMKVLQTEKWDELDLWVPEFLANDEYSFSYSDREKKQNVIYSYLQPSQLALEMNLSKATADTLRNKKVYAYSHAEERVLSSKSWSVYSCVVFEHQLNSEHFILTDGVWKKVDGDFYDAIVKFVRDKVVEEPAEKAFTNISIADMKEMKNKESVFNEEVCRLRPSAIMFDRSKLRVGKDIRNKEFCDILDLTDDSRIMRIINCKPYSGGSALSHLFAQASFYCEAFVSDQNFLNDIRGHIKKSKSPHKAKYLKFIKTNQKDVVGSDYRVCLWLLCDSRKPLPTRNDMPLMARYELKLMHERLQRVFKFKDIRIRFVPVVMTDFKKMKAPKAKRPGKTAGARTNARAA
jgi:uncharacterized protein (TIGR04141 family)